MYNKPNQPDQYPYEQQSIMSRRQITTMCPMNCHPTYCGMLVEVEGDNVIALKGDPENPDSRGFLCVRGRATRELVKNSKRLLTPLRRVGRRGEDAWEPVSWEEVLSSCDLVIPDVLSLASLVRMHRCLQAKDEFCIRVAVL